MRRIPFNDETKALAARLIWFEPAEEALADPIRFMAYAFARATHEEMNLLRGYLDEADFAEALANAPAGIIDPRSWAYWNARIGRYPTPPMPSRRFG